jgi:hypothetical protein
MGLCEAGLGNEAAVALLLEELDGLNRDLEVPSPEAYGIDETRYLEVAPIMAGQVLASGAPNNSRACPAPPRWSCSTSRSTPEAAGGVVVRARPGRRGFHESISFTPQHGARCTTPTARSPECGIEPF